MRSRIAQLEEQVFQLKHSNAIHSPATTPSTSHGKADATDPGVGLKPSLNISYESEIFGEALFTSRNVMHKRRVFGQSHCINGVAIVRSSCYREKKHLTFPSFETSLQTSSLKLDRIHLAWSLL